MEELTLYILFYLIFSWMLTHLIFKFTKNLKERNKKYIRIWVVWMLIFLFIILYKVYFTIPASANLRIQDIIFAITTIWFIPLYITTIIILNTPEKISKIILIIVAFFVSVFPFLPTFGDYSIFEIMKTAKEITNTEVSFFWYYYQPIPDFVRDALSKIWFYIFIFISSTWLLALSYRRKIHISILWIIWVIWYILFTIKIYDIVNAIIYINENYDIYSISYFKETIFRLIIPIVVWIYFMLPVILSNIFYIIKISINSEGFWNILEQTKIDKEELNEKTKNLTNETKKFTKKTFKVAEEYIWKENIKNLSNKSSEIFWDIKDLFNTIYNHKSFKKIITILFIVIILYLFFKG